jgi:hypothetical protein
MSTVLILHLHTVRQVSDHTCQQCWYYICMQSTFSDCFFSFMFGWERIKWRLLLQKWLDTYVCINTNNSAGGLLVTEGITRPVVSVSTQTWPQFAMRTYFWARCDSSYLIWSRPKCPYLFSCVFTTCFNLLVLLRIWVSYDFMSNTAGML